MNTVRRFLSIATAVLCIASSMSAKEFNKLPVWKWTGPKTVVFSYDGTFEDDAAFSIDAANGKKTVGVKAPYRYSEFPVHPEGAVNMTYSPDSTKIAFTRNNDLYVIDIASNQETRLTYDGTDLILNGYASWVYYEEILGRPSMYRAFWWSPDGQKIGYYRFDNTNVPLFPIYSAVGQYGSIRETRYPKAGDENPKVRIGIADLATGETTWAAFDENLDQYFGIPFWGPDSNEFFIARMPRLQNTLDLYAVSVSDGSLRSVYHETYPTWLDWIDSVVFTDKGLYMARRFETGWDQLYFLSYDGKEFRRLTDGTNWRMEVLGVDERKGEVYFKANRDASVRSAIYKVDKKGVVKALTDPAFNVDLCEFSDDYKYFTAMYSNMTTPSKISVFRTADGRETLVADRKGEDYDASAYALPELVSIVVEPGLELPAMITYPKNFDPSKKYPVHVDIYGGPDTPMVRDRWRTPDKSNQWWAENGIIQVVADCRAAGHNGRKGLDMIYKNLTVWEVKDFVSWAEWLKSLPYVDGDRIGVEGFSFGGTMTTMLLMQAPDSYHFGIAGGGVYDWALYDSHYTERYMDTPQNNPEGYAAGRVLDYVDGYPVNQTDYPSESSSYNVMLKLTHGTGDDNVHFQNTLQLIDKMQKAGKVFDFMIYPDGMHGYRDLQRDHFNSANCEFWLKWLRPQE